MKAPVPPGIRRVVRLGGYRVEHYLGSCYYVVVRISDCWVMESYSYGAVAGERLRAKRRALIACINVSQRED